MFEKIEIFDKRYSDYRSYIVQTVLAAEMIAAIKCFFPSRLLGRGYRGQDL